MIDYEKLLKKYIEYVGISEGVDYITSGVGHDIDMFTEDEWNKLKEISYLIHMS